MSEQEKIELERREKSEAEFFEFIGICIEEGWSPTVCPENCIVELDGICLHSFKSFILENGFI